MHLSDTAPHNDPDLPSPPDSGNVPRPAGRSGRKLAFDKHDLNTRLQQLAAEWDVERII